MCHGWRSAASDAGKKQEMKPEAQPKRSASVETLMSDAQKHAETAKVRETSAKETAAAK